MRMIRIYMMCVNNVSLLQNGGAFLDQVERFDSCVPATITAVQISMSVVMAS
jgi:hypothetical protein